MSIFSTILNKLGIHKPAAPAAPAETTKPPATATPYTPGHMGVYGGPPASTPSTPPTPSTLPVTPPSSGAAYTPGQNYPQVPVTPPTPPTPVTPAAPVEMPMVDVVSHLDTLAKSYPVKLNWRQSINDLMALLGLSHTPDDIKELAVELGCPEKEMADSYSRNVWTHQTLLKKIAENGGNIPSELLK
jgi:hypothetical protein